MSEMKRFRVHISQRAYREGTYIVEAPDKDAAYRLAEDIPLSDDRIHWDEWTPSLAQYVRPEDISVEEPVIRLPRDVLPS